MFVVMENKLEGFSYHSVPVFANSLKSECERYIQLYGGKESTIIRPSPNLYFEYEIFEVEEKLDVTE